MEDSEIDEEENKINEDINNFNEIGLIPDSEIKNSNKNNNTLNIPNNIAENLDNNLQKENDENNDEEQEEFKEFNNPEFENNLEDALAADIDGKNNDENKYTPVSKSTKFFARVLHPM